MSKLLAKSNSPIFSKKPAQQPSAAPHLDPNGIGMALAVTKIGIFLPRTFLAMDWF